MEKAIAAMALMFSAIFLAGTCMAAENMATEEMNIVETAQANGNFTNLVGALQEAGLVDTLSEPGPFTVFAPDDTAFNKLATEDLKALLENKTELTKVLTFHVVNGKIMAKDLKDGEALQTIEGKDLIVKINGTEVMVDNAKVVQADIETSNGVIHVIDTVLMPTA
jgi:uncharacterized surface protein with fasciclin (FAS1) repeats